MSGDHAYAAHQAAAARILAALADLDQVARNATPRTHWAGCWTTPWHGECLATRIRATLTGEDRHA